MNPTSGATYGVTWVHEISICKKVSFKRMLPELPLSTNMRLTMYSSIGMVIIKGSSTSPSLKCFRDMVQPTSLITLITFNLEGLGYVFGSRLSYMASRGFLFVSSPWRCLCARSSMNFQLTPFNGIFNFLFEFIAMLCFMCMILMELKIFQKISFIYRGQHLYRSM